MAVDHPEDVAVFVDERFARESPALAVQAMRRRSRSTRAWDETGRDVTDLVSAQDGRYLGTFARGPYQGVAAGSFRGVRARRGDVSACDDVARRLRVRVSDRQQHQRGDRAGRAAKPRGLSLEAQDATGRWMVVAPDLGFPAGKNKTILIDLGRVARAGVAGARRLRLRTNLEIYWDSLGFAVGVSDAPLKSLRLEPARADLGYRGFSVTRSESRDRARNPDVRSDRQHRPALARSGRLLHAVRRCPRAPGRRRRSLRDHERGRRIAAGVLGACRRRRRAGPAISCSSATAG